MSYHGFKGWSDWQCVVADAVVIIDQTFNVSLLNLSAEDTVPNRRGALQDSLHPVWQFPVTGDMVAHCHTCCSLQKKTFQATR